MKKYVCFLAFWVVAMGLYAQKSGSFVLTFDGGKKVNGTYSSVHTNEKITVTFKPLTWNPPEGKDKFQVTIEWANPAPNLKLLSNRPRPLGSSDVNIVFPVITRAEGSLTAILKVTDRESGAELAKTSKSISYSLLSPEEVQANKDEAAWSKIKNSKKISDYQAYLRAFPSGKYKPSADSRIKELRKLEQDRIHAQQQALNNQNKTEEPEIKEPVEDEPEESSEIITDNEGADEIKEPVNDDADGDNESDGEEKVKKEAEEEFNLESFLNGLDSTEQLLYGGGALLLVFILGVIVARAMGGKKKKEEKLEKPYGEKTYVEKRYEEKPPVEKIVESDSGGITIIGGSKQKTEANEANHSAEKTVRHPQLQGISKEYNLKELWRDTAVSSLILTGDCIAELDEFVHEKNVDIFEENNDTVIPEIGGFLLGSYTEIKKNQFEVLINKFVPITPEENDLYRIEFGTQAWLELDRMKEDFPDLEVIGWFHTHPGHGLFLSRPDLNIHEGFFRNNYQVAMEMDTMTDRLDIAFFTRAKNGKLNNTDNRIKDSWFSWRELVEETS